MKIRTLVSIAAVASALACPVVAQELCAGQAQIWLDDTGSVAPAAVNQTAFQAIQALAQLPIPQRPCRIDLYQFTDQAIHATPFYRVQLPFSQPPECAEAKVAGEFKFLRAVNKTAEGNATKACKLERQKWEQQQSTQLNSELAKAKTAIQNRAKMQGQCTALTDVARRLARTPSSNVKLALIISDGIQSCATSGQTIISPKASMKTFMVVMPNTVRRNSGLDFNQIEANWHRLAPWINLILPDELGEALR